MVLGGMMVGFCLSRYGSVMPCTYDLRNLRFEALRCMYVYYA